MNFVDEYSRFMWIFPMDNKSKAFHIFVKFHAFVLNQFGVSIKCLQFDEGGEYKSKMFNDLLGNKGIKHMVSYPLLLLNRMVLLNGSTDTSLKQQSLSFKQHPYHINFGFMLVPFLFIL